MNDLSALARNLQHVRQRIAEAARASGRSPDAVKLVAVTKYVDAATAATLVDAGCFDLGESRPQELWRKAELLSDRPIRWHLIGHLQRNKIARTLPLVSLVHSADSLRVIEAIHSEAAKVVGTPRVPQRTTSDDAPGSPMPVPSPTPVPSPMPVPLLLEVNVSGDSAKHGFSPDDLPPLGPQLAKLAHVEIRGLMCMAGRESSLDEARHEFERLRLLRDHLRTEWPDRLCLDDLSMGMSGDFEAAIAEGATLVRVGSSLFE